MKEATISLERPAIGGDGIFHDLCDKSELLPAITSYRGFQLISITFDRDPYVIYNRFGQVVYQWDCDTTPNWFDVFQVCRELGLA